MGLLQLVRSISIGLMIVVEHTLYEEDVMKQLLARIVIVVALLVSGAVVTQATLLGTAYADGGAD
jgi:hypothetical protein